ncbi:MAG: hypothetical protein AAGE59_38420, partial [Cyanobacteria bacterium P01_F01_bin.86]
LKIRNIDINQESIYSSKVYWSHQDSLYLVLESFIHDPQKVDLPCFIFTFEQEYGRILFHCLHKIQVPSLGWLPEQGREREQFLRCLNKAVMSGGCMMDIFCFLIALNHAAL